MTTTLTLNTGSSSLRFAVFTSEGHRLLAGKFDRVGHAGAQLIVAGDANSLPVQPAAPRDCLPLLVDLFSHRNIARPGIIVHRIVHGGPNHFDPVEVSPAVMKELRAIEYFAPNHLPAALDLVEAALHRWPGGRQVACFDTAFHRNLPTAARLLPLPRRFDAQGVHRYGFHGLAYASVVAQLQRRAGGVPRRVILAHLGHGAGMAALQDGGSVDTTMAFTPIGGLVMSTRSGDLDPGVLAFVARREKLTPEALEAMLSRESGLLGLSGTSADMRELLSQEHADPRSAEALAVFVHSARKAIGALTAVLGGLDAIVFSGGIGENSAEIRTRLCAHFDYLGLRLDPERNRGNADVLSAPESRVTVHLIHADEEQALADAARDLKPDHRHS